MKSVLAIAALVTGLTAGTPKPKGIFPYPLTLVKLKSGLQVVLVPYDSPGLVAYYTLVRVGSRNEVEPGHSGFAHLFEHMMFRGTKRYPADKWETQLKSRGVNSNAFTWNDQTVYTFVAPSHSLATVIELEADRFRHLTYTKQTFQTEAKAVLGEYYKNYSNPEEKMEETLLNLAFSKHTYKHTTMGFLDDIRKMPERYEYGLQFFKKFYRPDNTTIFVVGDFDARKAVELIKKHYGGWSGTTEKQTIAAEPEQKKERRKEIDWKNPTQPRITIGFHTPSLGTDLQSAAVQNVLGPYLFGKGSQLHRRLVLEQQLAESVSSGYVDTRDPRLFSFTAVAKKEDALPTIEKHLLEALAALRKGEVDTKRLDAVKSNLRYGILMYMETPARIAEVLALLATPTGDPLGVNRLYGAIAKVTKRQIVKFAKAYLTKSNRTVVTLRGPSARKTGGAAKKGNEKPDAKGAATSTAKKGKKGEVKPPKKKAAPGKKKKTKGGK